MRRQRVVSGETAAQTTLFFRIFFTNPALDITVVACDRVSSDVPLTIDIHRGARGPLGVDSKLYILGVERGSKSTSAKSLRVGEARVSGEKDSVMRFATENSEAWLSGSAGFNDQGEFAFMVCEPRRANNSSFECQATNSQGTSVKQWSVPRQEILNWIEENLELAPDRDSSPGSDEPRSPSCNSQVSLTSSSHHFHNQRHQPPHNHHFHHHHINLPDTDLDIITPCAYASSSPRSCCSSDKNSSGLNPRQPWVSYPTPMSTKSSPRSSPQRRRTSPNPRLPGVAYSASPTRSAASVRSRSSARTGRSTVRSSHAGVSSSPGRSSPGRSSPPRSRASPPRSSPRSRRRSSPLPLSNCFQGSPSNRYDDEPEHHQSYHHHECMSSSEYESPPLPFSSSSEEDPATGGCYSHHQPCPYERGRARSVAATRQHLFKGPSCRPVRARTGDECSSGGATDGEVYLGVGYMKHTHVSRNKASNKFELPTNAVWHH